jgi:hypothetical protein
MNVLSGGRPVAYLSDLDRIKFDSNGFVASGLVCHVSAWSVDIYTRVRDFYEKPAWRDVMRTYDAAYGADVGALKQAAAATVKRHLCRPANPILL